MKTYFLVLVILGALSSLFVYYFGQDVDNVVELVQGKVVRLKRNNLGVFVGQGETLDDLARALGYAHAADRFSQMDIQRVVGNGRLSEILVDSPGAREMDIFLRELGFPEDAKRSVKNMSGDVLSFLTAYVSGVNKYLYGFNEITGSPTAKRSIDMIIAGRSIEPWTIEDTLVCGKLLSYVGLASLHLEFENVLFDILRSNKADFALLKQIYSPLLDHVDDAVDLFKQFNVTTKVQRQTGPTLSDITKLSGLSFKASNNWVVSTGESSIMAFDPHLEIHRLPSVWYEFIFQTKKSCLFGISVPGIPIILMGRNDHISWSFTYGFMDQLDIFIEQVRNGMYRRGDNWLPLIVRKEAIKFKSEKDTTSYLFYYESDIGVIERDDVFNPSPPADGFYRTTAWTNRYDQVSANIAGGMKLITSGSVDEAKSAAIDFSVSLNFLAGDDSGNIGYQQTGNAPIRAHGTYGLLPLPAWKQGMLWDLQFVPSHALTSITRKDKWIATANNDMQSKAKDAPLTLNLHMGSHRVDRINELLSQLDGDYSAEKMAAIQLDLVSNHAKQYMKVLGPLIPTSGKFSPLLSWNLSYHDCIESRLFEELYDGLLNEIIGKGVLHDLDYFKGRVRESPWVISFFSRLDDYILQEISKHPLLVKSVLDALATTELRHRHTYDMNNIYTDGKLPDIFGFDVPNIFMPGDRGTISQGQIWKEAGRVHTFGPSYRAVVDLRLQEVFGVFPGGVSSNPLSKLYKSSLADYFNKKMRKMRVIA